MASVKEIVLGEDFHHHVLKKRHHGFSGNGRDWYSGNVSKKHQTKTRKAANGNGHWRLAKDFVFE
jgi:hypothetical protein